MDPVRRFATFTLLMGLGLGLAALAFLFWHKGDTWPAIRATVLAASTLLFALWLVRRARGYWLRAVKDDLTKRKPLQFSMRRLLIFVTILCVEAALFAALTNQYSGSQRNDIAAMMLIFVAVSTIASGVILRKSLAGALWGAATFIAVIALTLLLGGRP
jgi:magnesium-transporting ATPase (P-type)